MLENNIGNNILFFSPPNIDDRIAFQRSIFSIAKSDTCIEEFLKNGEASELADRWYYI